MPVRVICGYPCNHCGCSSIEVNPDHEYYWVDFGVILIEAITNYACKNCKNILIQVTNHKEEKSD